MANFQSAQRPISSLPISAKLSIPGSPDWVAIGSDAVWISNKAKDAISRIDPATNRVVATVGVGKAPCSGLAVGFGSVWVPSCGSRQLDRVDANSNQVVAQIKTTIADSEGGIAAGDQGVWLLADGNGTLLQVDPSHNEIIARVQVATGSFVPAIGHGSVWVTSTEGDLVTRVDLRGHQAPTQIAVGPSPRFIACSEFAVWTLNQGDGTVSRIDPTTNLVVATVEVGVPGQGGDIAVGEGSVWVTAIDVPLTQIDADTNEVIVQFVGTGGDALRIGHGSAWMCSFFLQEVWRVPLPL
jgi:virginiamycin B lyase